MSRFRFSITSFLVVVTLLAAGLAAFVSQSQLAGNATYTVFVGLLCLSVAASFLQPLPAKAFWLGFAVFGWTYWFVEFPSNGNSQQQSWGSIVYTRSLGSNSNAPGRAGFITGDLIAFIEAHMTPNRAVGAKVMAQYRNGSYYSGTITQSDGVQYLITWDDGSAPQWTASSQIAPSSPSILIAGHALMGELFALIGGIVVALMFGRKVEAKKLEAPS